MLPSHLYLDVVNDDGPAALTGPEAPRVAFMVSRVLEDGVLEVTALRELLES